MLEDVTDQLITRIIEDEQNHSVNRLYFQLDGVIPHYFTPVREILDNRFSGRRI